MLIRCQTFGILISLVCLGGCSATSLRCGVDGDSSFVEIYAVPQNFSQQTRSYAELCAFAYSEEKTEVVRVVGEIE